MATRLPADTENSPRLQLIVFAGVGVISTLLHYVTMIGLVELRAVDPVLSTSIGYATGAVSSYALNQKITFGGTSRHRRAIPRFIAMVGIGFWLNGVLVWIMTVVLGIWYLLGQLVATMVTFLSNFLISRFWVFRRIRLDRRNKQSLEHSEHER